MSINYYQQHAQRFFDETVRVDMSALHDRFLAYLSPGARILDAGCGSGRDASAFLARGYAVEAFDASFEMAQRAAALTGLPVSVMRFEDFSAPARYDGIWCCASLLHVAEADLLAVFARLANALKPNGVWYLSFKLGRGEREKDGRRFTDMDEARLRELMRALPELKVKALWQTADKRVGRDEAWVNGLVMKVG
ncbi:class I SAM-dependent methyltransferase [Pantoea sp. FN0305]|uniref:class I SAM-dependent methyltransferase n=1 Tax=Pantoea sp. FN0305 TaxID=3418559 RepID=UPI003CF063AB